MIEILSENDKIDVAEPNQYLTACSTPSYDSYRLNDEYAAYLYQNNSPAAKNTAGKGVDSRGSSPSAAVSVNAASGWKKLTGKEKESVVAVLDTGVNTSHEDLKNVLWNNPGNIGLKGKHGYNFLADNTDISDPAGHGTHCGKYSLGRGCIFFAAKRTGLLSAGYNVYSSAKRGEIMLELLLMTYKDMFGEDFPIADFAGTPEIDVINILYDCVRNNLPYDPNRTIKAEITDAPGLNK